MNHLWPHLEVLSKYLEVADARDEKSVNDAYKKFEELEKNLTQHKLNKSICQSLGKLIYSSGTLFAQKLVSSCRFYLKH